jgi:hypothetical protein
MASGGHNVINIAGQRFGHWTVIARHSERRRHGHYARTVPALWLCRCDCGTERIVRGSHLRSGATTSCGCAQRQLARGLLTKLNTKHGMSGTRAYVRWANMKQRCFNPRNPGYPDYGGRGITVCEEWHKDFLTFYANTGDAPLCMSFDRINNAGNYEPTNWRWAPRWLQTFNRRKPRRKE